MISRIAKFIGKIPFVLILLAFGLLAYGFWIPRLGFYWDDFPFIWIARTYGAEGLARYFATNRPFWGLVFQLTTPLLGTHPLGWQVFGLAMRLLDAWLLWQVVRLAWPRLETAGRWAGLLLLLYPGFSQQSIAVVYGHMELILAVFLGSMALMLLGLRREKPSLPLLGASLGLSLVNVFCMEYFMLLELARPVLIWSQVETKQEPPAPARKKLLFSLWIWLPFLLVLLAAMFWRTFGLGFQTYQPALAGRLEQAPLTALGGLLLRALQDLWLTAGAAWGRPFALGGLGQLTRTQLAVFWGVALVSTLAALVWLAFTPARGGVSRKERRELFVFALILLGVAGAPYWLTDLPITASFPFDRFTLSFMSGAALLLAALWFSLPLPKAAKIIPLALLVGFSAALQYRHTLAYARDWSLQRSFFWQLRWRMPGLQPNTALLFNELPFEHYSDNSLTAPLNWIYAPENRNEQMAYVLYYPTVRLGRGLPRLQEGVAIEQDYLASYFRGSTSQVVVLYFEPPGCLRVMDAEVEEDIWLIPQSLRDTLKLSSTEPILPGGDAQLPAEVYGQEPSPNWCYYFEKADLARQQQDWETAARLGEEAFALGDYPNDPVERFPFIEAWAHVGDWQRALDLTRQTRDIAPLYAQLGCRLWERIGRETQADALQQSALREAHDLLGCAAAQEGAK